MFYTLHLQLTCMISKDEILRLLREDPDFRKQVEEILGIDVIRSEYQEMRKTLAEIVASLRALTESSMAQAEAQKRMADGMTKLEEKMAELAEAQRKTQEALLKLEDRTSKLEEKMAELAEAQRKTQEALLKLEDRTSKLEEKMAELVESQRRMQEAFLKLEDRTSKLEEKMAELAEAQRKTQEALLKLEDRTSKLEDTTSKLEAKMVELAEAQRKTEEALAIMTQSLTQVKKGQEELAMKVERMEKTVSNIGKRWGEDYEELVRGFFRDFVDQEGLDFSYVNRFTYKDKDGKYGKKGARYEVDILAKNGKVYLVEVKSFAENDDIEWFDVKTDVIIDVLGIKNFVKLFLAVSVDKDALETAKDLGIRLVYGDVYERKKSTSDSEL
ncbi:hypothetical protein HA72_1768 [Metallosphaera sedula]|uniref:Chromosome segregation ATPase-like protein n=4 Tax=Sulfolobaceae TaxID=118883 RepID=A4YHM1_METS5|nr:hypothetical protein Msed_1768 [Metallosphaera sedula DSM 5348]AIM27907.1 hypothetical protein HA72_1768 [Metallosphaera sedula]